MQVDNIEAAVLRHYATITLPANFAERVRAKLDETLADQERGTHLLREQRSAALQVLDTKEEHLLDLVADPDVPKDKIRRRLLAIGAERQKLTEELETRKIDLTIGAAVIRAALDLLDEPAEMYRQAGPTVRRLLNQAFFTVFTSTAPR